MGFYLVPRKENPVAGDESGILTPEEFVDCEPPFTIIHKYPDSRGVVISRVEPPAIGLPLNEKDEFQFSVLASHLALLRNITG